MLEDELRDLINYVRKIQAESDGIEVKSAHIGCPQKLYDTLSSFSNRDDGGVILFGLDEKEAFKKVGVYDAHDLQHKIAEQCKQMQPVVRPLFTIYKENDMCFLSAEIPSIDISERPCYYSGRGQLKGSFVRVGEADEPMTDYEIYSFEAYRRKYQDDIRPVDRADRNALDPGLLEDYERTLKKEKPNLAPMPAKELFRLMSLITPTDKPTLTALMVFCAYPQIFYRQLSIIATVVPGTEMGDIGAAGERFYDNKRLEGPIPQMLEDTLLFVAKNMKTKTVIKPSSGKREDIPQYPMVAVREAVLNALVHRDYSFHTEGMPIQVTMYEDRMEIRNPGGLYGRIKIDQLGKMQPDTRNPVLATTLETLRVTENRYSGIPTIRREMERLGLPAPVFEDSRGSFMVVLYNNAQSEAIKTTEAERLIVFCKTPRSRDEILAFLRMKSLTYAMQRYVQPLVDAERLFLTIPEKPKSKNQKYFS